MPSLSAYALFCMALSLGGGYTHYNTLDETILKGTFNVQFLGEILSELYLFVNRSFFTYLKIRMQVMSVQSTREGILVI